MKLHGAQTGFLRCADEFPAWKGELHGTQTHRNIQETTNLVWKKIKLHGTQTEEPQDFSILKAWRKVKLHGTQTRAATDPLVLEKKKLHGTQIRYGKQL